MLEFDQRPIRLLCSPFIQETAFTAPRGSSVSGCVEFLLHLVSGVRIRGVGGKAVHRIVQIVKLLPHVKRHEHHAGIVFITPRLKNAGNRQVLREGDAGVGLQFLQRL